MSTAITTSRPVDRRDSHAASFATRWLQPSVAVITAHGELDASNAQEFVDYALRTAVSRLLRICDPDSALPIATTMPAALSMLQAEQRRLLQLVSEPS